MMIKIIIKKQNMNMKFIPLFKPLGFSPLPLRSLHCLVIRPIGNNIIVHKVNIATIRCFSSSPSLKTDEDILTRLNNLIETSKKLVNEGKKYTDNKEEYKKLLQLREQLHEKAIEKEISLKVNISLGAACLNEEEDAKVKINNNTLSKGQNLVLNKLNEMDENDDNYFLGLLKLYTQYNKTVINKLEKTQNIVFSAVKRENETGNFPDADMYTFIGFYAKYNHEKEKYGKEEKNIFSMISSMESKSKEVFSKEFNEVPNKESESKILSLVKEKESESIKSNESKDKPKGTTMDFIAQKMDEDMPSYMDPED